MRIGVLAELEQAVRIVVTILLDRTIMAIALLVNNALIAKSVLQNTRNIAIAVLCNATLRFDAL